MNKSTVVNLEQELAQAEEGLIKAKERLAELRRRLPREEVEDYALKGGGWGRCPSLQLLWG